MRRVVRSMGRHRRHEGAVGERGRAGALAHGRRRVVNRVLRAGPGPVPARHRVVGVVVRMRALRPADAHALHHAGLRPQLQESALLVLVPARTRHVQHLKSEIHRGGLCSDWVRERGTSLDVLCFSRDATRRGARRETRTSLLLDAESVASRFW